MSKYIPYLVIAVLLFFQFKSCDRINLLDQQKKAIADTTVTYRNKNNQLIAEKLAFVGDKQDLKAEIERWKNLGDTLQNKLTSKTKELIFIKRKINIGGSGYIQPAKPDTVYIAKVKIDTPLISIDTADAYHSFKFASNRLKYAYELSVTDKSELKIEDNGRKGTKVTLLNKNPYIVSTEIKAIIISPKKPSLFDRVIWLVAGVGVGSLVR